MSDADNLSERTDDPSTHGLAAQEETTPGVPVHSAHEQGDPAGPPVDAERARAERRRGVRYGLALACVVAAVYL